MIDRFANLYGPTLGAVAGEPPKLAAQTMPSRLGAGGVVEGTDFMVVTRARFQDRMGFERPEEARRRGAVGQCGGGAGGN